MTAYGPCITQMGNDPNLVPVTNLGLDQGASVVVGLNAIIPRWKTSTSNPLTLYWFLEAQSFPIPLPGELSWADEAAAAFNEAAQEWNNVKFGVTVFRTQDRNAADFNLVYQTNNPYTSPRALAFAFFPSDPPTRNVIVFELAMMTRLRTLKNIFLHELGHIFGLRHEFAMDGWPTAQMGFSPSQRQPFEDADSAVRIGPANNNSVMEYNDVPMIQDSDRNTIRQFYQLPNGHDIAGNGTKIKDYPEP